MKKYLLSLTLSLLFIPIVLWGQNTSAKSLSSRLDTLIKYQLPAGSNVGISIYDLTTGKFCNRLFKLSSTGMADILPSLQVISFTAFIVLIFYMSPEMR